MSAVLVSLKVDLSGTRQHLRDLSAKNRQQTNVTVANPLQTPLALPQQRIY